MQMTLQPTRRSLGLGNDIGEINSWFAIHEAFTCGVIASFVTAVKNSWDHDPHPEARTTAPVVLLSCAMFCSVEDAARGIYGALPKSAEHGVLHLQSFCGTPLGS